MSGEGFSTFLNCENVHIFYVQIWLDMGGGNLCIENSHDWIKNKFRGKWENFFFCVDVDSPTNILRWSDFKNL